MPNRKFIEEYPLYRKMNVGELAYALNDLPKVGINVICDICDAKQTFHMTNNYEEICSSQDRVSIGKHIRLRYLCALCKKGERIYLVKIGGGDFDAWIMKIGQYPAWDVDGDVKITALLGKHSSYYKKGLICESQGYGIGAFGYYRRIVEETIDGLLDEIPGLLTEEDLSKYNLALSKTKTTNVTSDKIDLVKDLLPPILRPNNMNPLAILHTTLSQGLHAESDEECLTLAEKCRVTLLFLVHQLATSKESAKSFTSSMQSLLDKKSSKKSAV